MFCRGWSYLQLLGLFIFLIFSLSTHSVDSIVNGGPANENEFPSIGSLKLRATHICGATLIAPQYVMTGAHCVFEFRDYTYTVLQRIGLQVVLGEHNQESSSGQEIIVPVKHISLNRRYRSTDHYIEGDDIAILKLDYPVKESTVVKIARLADANTIISDGTECTIAGWGSISENGKTPHHILIKGVVKMVSNSQCANHFPLVKDNSRMLCSGPGPHGATTCSRDTGGPLYCSWNGEQVQVGITSYGHRPCGQTDSPSVFTNVAYYRKEFIDPSIIDF